jgi:hypothetical protein
VFGVTISLYRAGVFEWDEFRRLLIQEIESSRIWARRMVLLRTRQRRWNGCCQGLCARRVDQRVSAGRNGRRVTIIAEAAKVQKAT